VPEAAEVTAADGGAATRLRQMLARR
jgi:hypothetical protein